VELPPALAPLIEQRRWLIWKWEWRTGRKPPIDRDGRYINAHDPGNWLSYEEACAALAPHHQLGHSHRRVGGDGLGFALAGSGIGAFDLDHCRDRRWLAPSAEELVERAQSYTEVTPSRKGLRILGLAAGGEVHRKLKTPDAQLEIFRDCRRYITVSGAQIGLGGEELVNIDALIDELAAEQKVPAPVRLLLPRSNDVSPLAAVAIANKHSIGGLLRHSLLYGEPGPDADRSAVMWWQARCLLERGVPEDEAFVLIDNSHWNKHAHELRNEKMIRTLIEKAWALPFTPWGSNNR
jgi:hypothetical protein